MTIDNIQLPTDKKTIARIIDRHVEREETRLSYRYIMWLLAWHYVNGARRFDSFNPATGLLTPHVLDEDGQLEFQSQELLAAIDRVSGRIAGMDLRPKVNRQGMSLGGIQERSIAQIILDAVVNSDHLEKVKTQFAHLLVTLGSVGITGHVLDHDTIGLTADFEVIHPRELFPFPSLGNNYLKERGLIRERVVPLKFLQEKFGRRISDNLKHMEWWENEAGEEIEDWEDIESHRFGNTASTSSHRVAGQDNGSPDTIGVVKIRELWLYGERDTVTRYVITSGLYTIMDQDFSGVEVYCPVKVARFIETGTFHGAGLFDLLFSIHREMEKLLKDLFLNIRELDKYGIVVLPQGQMNQRTVLRDVGKGLWAYFYDPDPVAENFRPFNIAPNNTGDVPGKVAAFAKDLMHGINPVQDLIQEKGRVDSAAGLGFLDEQITRAMTTATRAVESAWGGMYRSVLAASGRMLHKSPRPLPVSRLTLDLAGAVIDPKSSMVSFDENPLPTIGQLQLTIKETSPRSAVARKQEAIELYQMPGFDDPDAFRLFALEEGLDFAFYLGEHEGAYESVVRNCLLLFGDGTQPGEVTVTPHTAKPEFQLRVLSAFMSHPRMGMAAPQVQDEFKRYREFLLDAMGMILPEATPNPDDMAALQMIEEQMMASGGQPQSLPFPSNQGVA